MLPPCCSTLFPYTTLFRSVYDDSSILVNRVYGDASGGSVVTVAAGPTNYQVFSHGEADKNKTPPSGPCDKDFLDRKSTRLNSSHLVISYAVFCLKKKNDGD